MGLSDKQLQSIHAKLPSFVSASAVLGDIYQELACHGNEKVTSKMKTMTIDSVSFYLEAPV